MINFSGIKIKVAGRQPACFTFQLYFSVHPSTLVALFLLTVSFFGFSLCFLKYFIIRFYFLFSLKA